MKGLSRRLNSEPLMSQQFKSKGTYRHPGWIGTDRMNRDILSPCLSRLELGVPIHLLCPDPPCLMVEEKISVLLFYRSLTDPDDSNEMKAELRPGVTHWIRVSHCGQSVGVKFEFVSGKV